MKSNKKIILIFIVVGILLFGILGYKVYVDFIRDNTHGKVVDTIGLYGYTLTKEDTSYYKEAYKELESVLKGDMVDYEKYASSLSKLFVIDVFTLDNKITCTDIGGLEFLHPDLRDNFKENMSGTLYKHIESNIEGNRKQSLPVVSKVTVDSVFQTKYEYNKVSYDAYIVSLNWEYEKNDKYQTSIKLTLIKDDKMIYIVKGE